MQYKSAINLGRGFAVFVDPDIPEWLLGLRWKPQVHRSRNKVYAQASFNGRVVYLHRMLTEAPQGSYVDHLNGNPLDNRSENLRVCTPSQNSANRRDRRTGNTGYKGVWWSTGSRKWAASITAGMHRYYLGVFNHKIRAAQAYDRAALYFFGDHAALNFERDRDKYRPVKPRNKGFKLKRYPRISHALEKKEHSSPLPHPG